MKTNKILIATLAAGLLVGGVNAKSNKQLFQDVKKEVKVFLEKPLQLGQKGKEMLAHINERINSAYENASSKQKKELFKLHQEITNKLQIALKKLKHK